MSDKQPRRRDPLRDRRPAAERIPKRREAAPDEPTRSNASIDIQQQQPIASEQGKAPRRRRRKRDPLSVPWWGFLLMILVVGGTTCGLWAYVLSVRDDTSAADLGPTPTPIFVVITATPTLDAGGPDPTPTLGSTQPTAPPLPPTSTNPPENLEIAVGSNVTISGTGDLGLSIRQGPGTGFSIFAIGQDGDRFVVEDGPREADGFTWWYIVDPTDEDRAGWAVQQFMSLAP